MTPMLRSSLNRTYIINECFMHKIIKRNYDIDAIPMNKYYM